MVRSILAVLAGVVTAGILIFALQSLGHLLYPPPPGIDPSDPASLAAAMSQMPAGALVAVLAAYAIGTAAGGFVAAKIARGGALGHALAVGLIQLGFGLLNLLLIPHPWWFATASVLLFPLAALLGGRLAARR